MTKKHSVLIVVVLLIFFIFNILQYLNTGQLTNNLIAEKLSKGVGIFYINQLIKIPNDYICLLYPYQNKVTERTVISEKINDKIKNMDILSDESHFSLLFLKAEIVRIVTIKRSIDIDVLSKNEISTLKSVKIPNGFKPSNCASFDSAVFFKFTLNHRHYLILGEYKK